MAIQNFEELNMLKRRSLPYREYFGDMELTPKQKEDRERLALILEDYIMLFFDMIETSMAMNILNETRVKQELTYNLYDQLADKGYFPNDIELNKYITKTVDDAYTSTVDNLQSHPMDYDYTGNSPYWVSEDRAMFIAENEANTLFNSKEFVEASAQGKTHKIWMAYPDDRVRPTHVITNGSKIPIGAYFTVGNARMLYPKDLTSELSTASEYPEEYINCRCQVVYI